MSELVPIVNENDEIIGSKERSQVTQNDIRRISGLRLENSKGEVLIAKRAYTKKWNPGKRGPAVTGGVRYSESYEDTILRETKEELGIEVKNYKETSKVRYKMIFIQHFKAIMDIDINELKLQKEEVDSVKRIKKEELYKQSKENPDDFVPQLLEFIDEYTNN